MYCGTVSALARRAQRASSIRAPCLQSLVSAVRLGGIRSQATAASSATTISHQDRNLQFLEDRNARYLGWTSPENQARYLDLVFLRDSCTCSKCVNPATSQKEFDTTDIPLDLSISGLKSLPESRVEIAWTNDIPSFQDHKTVLDLGFWERNSSQLKRHEISYDAKLVEPWTRDSLTAVESELYVSYEAYIESDKTLHKVLQMLRDYGLVFVTGVPQDEKSVNTMSARIGPLQNTFYGETWNVRSVPSAKNVAYTSTNLGFHMDLLYMKDPPGLQYLHVMKQSAEGGESLWSDTLLPVNTIQRENPELAPSMWNFPLTYRYKNDGKWFQYSRAMLEGPGMQNADEIYDTWRTQRNRTGARDLSSPQSALVWGRHFDAVNWAPPFQAPLLWDAGEWLPGGAGESGLRDYIKMSKKFRAMIEDPENMYETKMAEGTCAVFDNRRVVHARKAFTSAGGERWLKGAYVDGNSFRARLRAFEAGL